MRQREFQIDPSKRSGKWPLCAVLFAVLCGCSEPPLESSTPEPPGDAFCGRPVNDFRMAVEMMLERKDNFPKVGEMAPNFALPTIERDSPISLAELHRDRPVVLILGSASCSVLGRSDEWIMQFHDRFADRFAFAFVYLRESHTPEGYQPAKYAEEVAPITDALTLDDRLAAARRYAEEKGFPFPVLVDTMNDETARRWSAWPVRLFVVDTDGSVLYSGGQAPWFYAPFEGYGHKPPVDPRLQVLPRSEISLEEFLESYE